MKAELIVDAPCALSATTARLLQAGARSLGALGLGCAALAAAALLLTPAAGAMQAAALCVLALLPLERLLALRLLFDAGLFTDLARQGLPGPSPLQALDQALHTLGLRAPATAVRPLDARVRGARRLLAWHAGCVVLQAAGALAVLLTRGAA